MKEIILYLIIATLPNGKSGVIDFNGKVYIPFEYERISNISEEFLKAKNEDGKWGIIDINNNIIAPFENEDIGYKMDFNLIAIKNNGKWGLMNLSKQIVIPYEYDRIGEFNEEGRAFATKDGMNGMIDTLGNEVISLKFRKLSAFHDGVSVYAKDDGITGCVNAKNEVLFELTDDYQVGYEHWYSDKKHLIKNRDGQNGLSGLIDLNGKTILEPCYDHEIRIIKYNGEEYIHGTNQKYIEEDYEYELFINGIKQDYNGKIRSLDFLYGVDKDRIIAGIKSNDIKYGVLSADGEFLISPKYKSLKYQRQFTGDSIAMTNLLIAENENGYGVIDENDEIVLDFNFPELRYLGHGIYRNDTQTDTKLYNEKGEPIYESENIWFWLQIKERPNTFYARDENKMYGIVDIEGNWIVTPKYKKLGFVGKYRETVANK